jgi:hypothetical protein
VLVAVVVVLAQPGLELVQALEPLPEQALEPELVAVLAVVEAEPWQPNQDRTQR